MSLTICEEYSFLSTAETEKSEAQIEIHNCYLPRAQEKLYQTFVPPCKLN